MQNRLSWCLNVCAQIFVLNDIHLLLNFLELLIYFLRLVYKHEYGNQRKKKNRRKYTHNYYYRHFVLNFRNDWCISDFIGYSQGFCLRRSLNLLINIRNLILVTRRIVRNHAYASYVLFVKSPPKTNQWCFVRKAVLIQSTSDDIRVALLNATKNAACCVGESDLLDPKLIATKLHSDQRACKLKAFTGIFILETLAKRF